MGPNREALPMMQRAIIQGSSGQLNISKEEPIPILLPGTALIKTLAVSLQPADYKMARRFPSEGAIVGSDFCGTIVQIHPEMTSNTSLKPGDIVCGLVYGSNTSPEEVDRKNGAFAEFVRAPLNFLLRLGSETNFTPAQAATLGTALATNALALWTDPLGLGLSPTPEAIATSQFPVLVYGGSTSVGTMAIQLLRLSSLKPVATCSPQNFDLVRKYGADIVFDYMRPPGDGGGKIIRTQTQGRLRHAVDCAVDEDSVACSYSALGRVGGRYAALESCPEEWRLKTGRRTIHYHFIMGLECFGEEVQLGEEYWRPADKGKLQAVTGCFSMFQRLLDDGKLMPHPIEVIEGGFEGILNGLTLLQSGKISGKKLVVVI